MSRRGASGAGEVCASGLNEASGSKVIRNILITNGIKKSANMDVFPWVPEFRSKCRSTLGCGTSTLIELIRTFNRNVNTNVTEIFKNPSLATRLKDLVKEYLMLFMHLYRYEQPQDQNREDYLEQMSDLLAVYVDLELVASKLVAGGLLHGQISARLLSCLCVCLDYSTEHVLDTLIKVRFLFAHFSHILDAIMSRLLKLIPPKPQSAVMYARYYLVYRIWKRNNSDQLAAVKRQPPLNAEALLGPVPANMPEFLLEHVMCLAPNAKPPSKPQPIDFYLRQHVDHADLLKACDQFLQYCKNRDAPKAGSEDDITERDKRLKSTNTSVSNKLSTVNTNFSKSSNSDAKSLPRSSASNIPPVKSASAKPSCSRRATAPVKAKLPPKTGDVEVIDLTSDEESKPKPNGQRRPARRRRLDWLSRAVQGVEAKIRETSQKREAPPAEEHRTEDSPGRSSEDVEARGPEERLEAQPIEEPGVVNLPEPTVCRAEVEPAEKPVPDEAPESSEKISRPSEEARLNVESPQEEPTLGDIIECHAEATTRLEEKDRADSGFSESDAPEVNDAEATSSFYDIQESGLDGLTLLACVLARQSATSNKSDKVLRLTDEERTDVGAPQAGTSTAEKSGASGVDEIQCHVEPKPRPEEKEVRVNNEANEIDAPAMRTKQPEVSDSEARNNFYDIQESGLDGLTLLACVLARQSAASNKKAEIKVKPYASLQEKREPESRVVDRMVSICPEDALDKVALQVEVSSSDVVPSRPPPEPVTYAMEDPVQSSLESNDNAHVILNGETVRLLQKSPNSNLYIINKAAVDISKVNYNSDEEDGGKPMIEPEESKCCPQSLMIKHEPDDVGLPRGRSIKPDPDYVGQPQPHDMHYPGHPPTGYCGYAPKIQQPSTGCACLNCVYCRQLPYYLSAQPVQTNPAVQEKRCMPTVAEAKLYEDHLIKPQPQLLEPPVEPSKIAVDKFNLTDSKLPLKKRLKAQRMGFVEQPSPAYPGTLMMSIADVDLRPGHAPLELGAEVEIAAAAVKTSKSRSGKEAKIKNQNMPDCFPRKSSGGASSKKKKMVPEEAGPYDLGASAPKKARKSGAKQTRSSRRTVPSVNYVYPEIDPEWNPSGKRKRKRTSR